MEATLGNIYLSEPWMLYQNALRNAPFEVTLHMHPAWQLTASLEGEFRFHTRDEMITIRPGEWILISPGIMHDSQSDSKRNYAMQIFFRRFSPALLPEFAERFNLRRDVFIKGSADRKVLEKISMKFPKECVETNRFHRSNKIFYALEFIRAALFSLPEDDQQKTKRNLLMEQVMEYMEEHFAEPLSIADFAEKAGLSESRFEVVFRKAAGCSPMKFFKAVKLGHAQSFLLYGHSVKESSILAGFSSVPYFCRCFQQSLGITPGEFKKNPFTKG